MDEIEQILNEEARNDTLLKKDNGQISSSEEGRANKREDIRSKIALFYVLGFLIIVVLVLLISAYKDFDLPAFKDLLLAVSAVLSGPLGFIIGYYFKSHKD